MTAPDATPEPGIFAASRAAADAAGFASFRHVASTGSTNVDLANEARAGDASPAVLVTDHQTAGRGRLDRTWVDDAAGQLMVSLRIPTSWGDVGAVGPAIAVLARAALAAAGVPALFKWPNDLGVRRADGAFAKLAGYLGEYVDGPEPVVILGMGLNVETAPFEGSASVRGEGGDIGRDAILAAILQGLPALLADPEAIRRRVLEHSATVGTRVRVEQPGATIVGRATGLTADGALLVDDGGTVHTIAVGDVVHLRSAPD